MWRRCGIIPSTICFSKCSLRVDYGRIPRKWDEYYLKTERCWPRAIRVSIFMRYKRGKRISILLENFKPGHVLPSVHLVPTYLTTDKELEFLLLIFTTL